MKMTELTVLRDDVEWKTRLDGKISEVEIDGRKISDVHDLTQKVIKMTRTIKVLAFTATSLALIAVVAITGLSLWLFSHEASIEQLLLTSMSEYNEMSEQSTKWKSHQRHRAWVHLKDFQGLHWDTKRMDWVKD
jgi:hypothetical protein